MSSSTQTKELQTRLVTSKTAIERTSRALASISSDIEATADETPAELPTLLKGLLLNFRHSTTSLALSFKPPLTIPAALQQLDKFTNELCQSASCVLAAAAQGVLGVMLDEWRDGVMDICTDAVRFLDVLADSMNLNAGGSGSGKDDNPYLHHTALVWDRVDKMTSDLSASEGQAVVKRWKMDTAVVKDAWIEFRDSIEGMEVKSSRNGGAEDNEDPDEEWDEDDMMGFGSDTITEDEKRTVEYIKPLLQLLQLLHAFLPRFIPSLDYTLVRGRSILKSSNSFITAFDDLICALYPEHSASGIEEALEQVDGAVLEVSNLMRKGRVNQDGVQFLDKWEAKMKTERSQWQERRMGLKGLMDSL